MDEEQIEEIRNMLNPKKEGNESSNSGTQEEASGSQNPPEPSLEAIIEKQFGSLIENDEEELQRTNSGRPKKRKWSQRTFSRMNRGSLRGSIFTLINTAMGLGMLAMP
jgi:hypothetical protein